MDCNMTVEDWLGNDELPLNIWKNKYQYKDETLDEWFNRVSGGNKEVKQLIKDKKFLFGGRILANRGLQYKGKKITLSNCYVIKSPKDNLESIFETGAKLARTYSYGGGCGIDISNLRPNGTKVNNAANTTSGAVSFMDFYSYITGLIGQAGRRGALMISISCEHPDLEEFIVVKSDLNKITKANISVRVTDEFMQAVINQQKFFCRFTCETGEVIEKEIDAYLIFHKLAELNWDYAEPGLLFWDQIKDWNLLSNNPEFEYAGVNPCAEEPLPAGGSCLLVSLNLAAFFKEGNFNYKELVKSVHIAVKAMNEVLDEGLPLHPLQEQRNSVRDWRQIGLGIMGIGDLLILKHIKYGSPEALNFLEPIYRLIMIESLRASALLAKEFGTYPKYDSRVLETNFIKNLTQKDVEYSNKLGIAAKMLDVIELIKKYGLINSQLLTCAPTGSLSSMLQVTGGIEPIFATHYTRKTESLHNEERYYDVFTPIIKRQFIDKGINKENLPDYVVTAEQIPYIERIKMQALYQEYCDASISSTVNLPSNTTVKDVEDLYIKAWQNNLKGITIFRSNCKRGAILSTDVTKNISSEITKRPEILSAKVVRFKNGDEDWIALVGLINNKPYEIFTGKVDMEEFPVPKSITEGEIIKVKTDNEKRYDFQYKDKYGYTNRLGGLSRVFNQEYWNYAKLISALLRGGIRVDKVVKIIDGMNLNSSTLNTWKTGVKRALKMFVEDGIVSHEKCPDCGDKLIYQGGCNICSSCGYSACGG